MLERSTILRPRCSMAMLVAAAGITIMGTGFTSAQVLERSDRPSGINPGGLQLQPQLVVGAPGEVFDLDHGQLSCTSDVSSVCEVRGGAAYVFGRRQRFQASRERTFELLPMQRIVASLPGSRDQFGNSSIIHDLDGDGRRNLVIGNLAGGRGVVGDASRPGLVHIFGPSGFGLQEQQILLPAQNLSFGTPGGQGHALALLDINQDGFPEIIAGSPGHPSSVSGGSGAIFVYRNQGEDFSHRPGLFMPGVRIISGVQMIDGTSYGQKSFGFSLASGDFNGDGIEDLAVGAPGARAGDLNDVGAVFELHGDGQNLIGIRLHDQHGLSDLEQGDEFGSALAVADFDGDGFDDLAVAARYESLGSEFTRTGLVLIFEGSPEGLVPGTVVNPRQMIENLAAESHFGFSMAAGDFDNDGRIELAVGAPGAETSSSLQHPLAVDDPARLEADRVARDFRAELCGRQIGDEATARRRTHSAPCEQRSPIISSGKKLVKKLTVTGAVYIFERENGNWRFEQTLGRGAERQDVQQFGFALGAADFDTDGISDLAVGAPNRAVSGPRGQRTGAAFIYLGSEDGMRLVQTISQKDLDPEEEGDRFGESIGIAP